MRKVLVALVILLFLGTLPFLFWQLLPSKAMPIAILDMTVPDESFREHQGLTFLLNHLKMKSKDGTDYNRKTDFFGFYPNDANRSHEIRPLPSDLSPYAAVYLADTYGVYTEDLPYNVGPRAGARSPKVYGGLDQKDWQSIISWINAREHSLLIAEFNSFASPTDPAVRDSVVDYLGLEWSGWVGRYFDELNPDKNKEIPQWILDEFGDSWTYSGEGFLLVNDFTFDVVVLQRDLHLEEPRIHLTFTQAGREQFGLETSPDYHYWFDLVTPQEGAVVLAEYQWHLSEAGKELLAQKGIPEQFAAVVKRESATSSSYYFAGDYNDVSQVPRLYHATGLPSIYGFAEQHSVNALYWQTYLPMMQNILNTLDSTLEKMKEGTQHQPPAMENGDATSQPATEISSGQNSPKFVSRVRQNGLQVLRQGEWQDLPVKGVNMGMAKPGTFPGEAAITEEEYYRWFEQIAAMNANTVRIYTLHPPGFYRALKHFNESHPTPLYIMQGVWVNEEAIAAHKDAFHPAIEQDFQNEMRKIADAIHGNIVVPPTPGHASGTYRADVSDYVTAWIIGIEWDPALVHGTNENNPDTGTYQGTLFETKGGAAFEHWLAKQMDLLTAYEMEKYGSLRPMSFTNWPTTDILSHPSDLSGVEAWVSVDPNAIITKGEMDQVGQFASYHVYPYYPDFINHDEKYQTYLDFRGEENNYAGYLHELMAAHTLPVLIAEFGVPASRGMAHESRFGWNQGLLSEEQQGQIDAHLFEDIMSEGAMGGLLFTWQDEWFKRTWNTMDYDNPTRRPYWSNAQTNEQQFGLLSFDRHKIRVNGTTKDDWSAPSLYEGAGGILRALYVDHDERYLYIRLDTSMSPGQYPLILLDTVPMQGNRTIAGPGEPIGFSQGIDFLVDLQPGQERLKIDPYYDFYQYLYGHVLKLLRPLPETPKTDSGVFSRIRYVLSREYAPLYDEKGIAWTDFETGLLRKGNGDPGDQTYDSLTDFSWGSDGTLEIRLPWLLLQSKDPSRKEFMGDLYKEGLEASVIIDGIGIGALLMNGDGTVADSFPAIDQELLPALRSYTWQQWDLPMFEERLKRSYPIIAEVFAQY
ncbi:MAG: hypothetical protein GX117_05695 [Candidatus Hydrogenedentes bacterium]|nr:hypothetical protein [Candidatus Hydrogenedentota bacterium]